MCPQARANKTMAPYPASALGSVLQPASQPASNDTNTSVRSELARRFRWSSVGFRAELAAAAAAAAASRLRRLLAKLQLCKCVGKAQVHTKFGLASLRGPGGPSWRRHGCQWTVSSGGEPSWLRERPRRAGTATAARASCLPRALPWPGDRKLRDSLSQHTSGGRWPEPGLACTQLGLRWPSAADWQAAGRQSLRPAPS